MSDYDDFVDGTADLPDTNVTWPLYGTGLENLGKEQRPVEWDRPEIDSDELLARVDACGLCFSDIKVLRLGPEHPRISGRDLREDPVILGHEVALTIVKVGEERAEDFSVGDRFVVQADIYYNGEGLAFGYALHGGLEQFVKIMDELDLSYPKFIDYAVPGNQRCGECPPDVPAHLEKYCGDMGESLQG